MYVLDRTSMETRWPKNNSKRDLNGTLQPNSAFINFRDVWSRSRQLLLLTAELRHLALREGIPRETEAAPTTEQAQGVHPGHGDPALPLPGCVTLSKSLNLFEPVSSPAEWRLSSLPPQAVAVTSILPLDLLYKL